MSGHVIYLQDDDQKIPKELQCTYCGLVLNEPVETSETELRFCGRCFDNAANFFRGPYQCDLDPEDIPISILQVKEQINNLKVKCENYTVGCDWKGLFKQLMQHSQDCQYVTRECNPGCGQRVPLIKMDNHLKNECDKRLVYCEHCDKDMYFIELLAHTQECYNAPRICRNCKKEIPASQLIHHMSNDCEEITCVCKDENKTYKVESEYFYDHLQDVSKLADHLGPMISEITKMSEAFKEMTMSHRLMTNKVEMIEKRNGFLEKEVQRLKEISEVKAKGEGKAGFEGSSSNVVLKTPSLNETTSIYTEQAVLHQTNYNTIHYDNPTNTANVLYIKAIEDKLERNIQSLQEQVNSSNAKAYGDQVSQYEEALATYKARLSEFENSMPTCSTNGEYLWHIPEVREKISKARRGQSIYIDSPPFYTGRNGYKMCIRAFPNGDGSGYCTHLSIFFVLMKSEYDPLLQWPFQSKVSLILVDQDHMKDLVQTFKPNAQSSSFQRPKTDMNVASGCPEFADLSVLDNASYVKDDVMYIKAIVDT